MCESFKVTPKYAHRHFFILVFILTSINGLPFGNQTDLMLNVTSQDLNAHNGNTSTLSPPTATQLSRHDVTKELNHLLEEAIRNSRLYGAANTSIAMDTSIATDTSLPKDNRSEMVFTNNSNELPEYVRSTSNMNSPNTSETLTTMKSIATINPSIGSETNAVLSNNNTLQMTTVVPITSTEHIITSTTTTTKSTWPTMKTATTATTAKSMSTIKPVRSKPGRPSLVQRLMLNSRPYQPGDKPLYSEPPSTPETDYDDFVPAFDLGEIPKLTTSTQIAMPSFYDATPPKWLLEQMSASTTTGSPRKVFEITVPLLDGDNGESTGDGESGQLVDSTSESSHGGIIPVQATTAIIISAIIGGCAIVFFSVVMALCIWRQHKSRRPIYPPNRPMIPTTSMTSINSQKSVGLFQR